MYHKKTGPIDAFCLFLVIKQVFQLLQAMSFVLLLLLLCILSVRPTKMKATLEVLVYDLRTLRLYVVDLFRNTFMDSLMENIFWQISESVVLLALLFKDINPETKC